ncbi:MAG TPA: hypothetical protein VJ483_04105, partial [Holophagaceae bacterium]|nr:hypothetical protein [Holophagaceae bacterium]
VDAGLITPEQLQSAITHQKIAKGRMGSNLVALGYITEEVLMDFLSRQLNVPRVDIRSLDIPLEVLKRIPRRMAEQYTMIPVAVKEPKTLVIAMADPMDLNGIDSARFATGLHIEPLVASHSALRSVIADQYRKVQILEPNTHEVHDPEDTAAGLPVNFRFEPMDVTLSGASRASGGTAPAQSAGSGPAFPRDPFFDEAVPGKPNTVDMGTPPMAPEFPTLQAPVAQTVVPERISGSPMVRLDSVGAEGLTKALIKLLVRRGIITGEDMQRTVANMVESGEITVSRENNNPTL